MALPHVQPGQTRNVPEMAGATKSSALVKTDGFEAIHLVVPEGHTIARHHVPGQITLYCMTGAIALSDDEREIAMGAGDWLYLEGGTPHAVRGVENAKLILTIISVPGKPDQTSKP